MFFFCFCFLTWHKRKLNRRVSLTFSLLWLRNLVQLTTETQISSVDVIIVIQFHEAYSRTYIWLIWSIFSHKHNFQNSVYAKYKRGQNYISADNKFRVAGSSTFLSGYVEVIETVGCYLLLTQLPLTFLAYLPLRVLVRSPVQGPLFLVTLRSEVVAVLLR